MHTKSIFDSESIWLSSPKEAIAALFTSPCFAVDSAGLPRRLRDSSVKTYLSRNTRFCAWLATTPYNLATLSTLSLEPFFLTITTPGNRYRYYQTLERVFDHLVRLNLRADNPVRVLAVRAPARSQEGHLDTQRLTAAQQSALLAALPGPSSNWKKARDRGLLSLILGAGLRVSEAIHLSINNLGQLDSDGTLSLEVFPQHDSLGRRHRTRIQAFAVQDVQAWIQKRAGLKLEGNLLFPSSLTSSAPLHPTSVYRLVSRTMAGIPAGSLKRRGARTLRSTFALNELAAGAPIAHLGESLGHQSDRSTRRYRELAKRIGQPTP